MESIKTINYKGMLIEVYQDDSPEIPREWDNLGTMVCKHRDYNLGDEDHGYSLDDYESWAEVAHAIKAFEDVAVILPLYLYDHSGLRMKVGSFQGLLPQGHAEFDSGQVGWIYITKQTIRKDMCRPRLRQEHPGAPHLEPIKRITAKDLARAAKLLESEVNTYDQYLSGQVYGYIALDPGTGDTIDSYWGFYGDPESYMLIEAYGAIDCHVAEGLARKARKIKAMINNHVPLFYRPAILEAI